MNILVVDDEKIVATSIKEILLKQCHFHVVQTANSFDQALKMLFNNNFDMALIDIHFQNSNKDGLDLCKEIRRTNKDIPIIIVTSASSIALLEQAFDLGVYDYIVKPFNKKELAIRVSRWINLPTRLPCPQRLTYQGLVYDQKTNNFFYKGRKVNLSKKKKALLILFMQHPERLLTTSLISEKYWGDYGLLKNRNLRSTIQNLRKSLEASNLDFRIHTIRGEGYILKST